MRCKACDIDHAIAYDPPDYYCKECLEIIFRTIGRKFTLGDAYRIVVGNDHLSFVGSTGAKNVNKSAYPDLWRPPNE